MENLVFDLGLDISWKLNTVKPLQIEKVSGASKKDFLIFDMRFCFLVVN